MFRYHPEIEGLKSNEDGSVIFLKAHLLEVKEYAPKNQKSNALYVLIHHRVMSVGRVVAACWLGLPNNPRWYAVRKDINKGYHYTNLYWAKPGTHFKKQDL